MGLLAVPGAAIGLAQAPDGADQAVELRMVGGRTGALRVLLVHEVRQRPAVGHAALRLVELTRHELHMLPFPSVFPRHCIAWGAQARTARMALASDHVPKPRRGPPQRTKPA